MSEAVRQRYAMAAGKSIPTQQQPPGGKAPTAPAKPKK